MSDSDYVPSSGEEGSDEDISEDALVDDEELRRPGGSGYASQGEASDGGFTTGGATSGDDDDDSELVFEEGVDPTQLVAQLRTMDGNTMQPIQLLRAARRAHGRVRGACRSMHAAALNKAHFAGPPCTCHTSA